MVCICLPRSLRIEFLTCVSHAYCARYSYAGRLSVRLSVGLSVTRWCCVETTQPIVKLSSLPGIPMIQEITYDFL